MFSDTTNGEGRSALPIQHSVFRLVFFSCNSTPCWWSRDRFPLIAGKGGHGVCLIKSPQAKGFSPLQRIAHRLFNLFQKETQNKKQTTPQAQQPTAHTEKQVCLELLGKQRAETEAGVDTWMGSFLPSTEGQVRKRLGHEEHLLSCRYG